MSKSRCQWAAVGDVNAFFGLMLDNIADLLLMVGLMSAFFDFPTSFSLRYMVPGTAIGVFVGDSLYFLMALHMARRWNRPDVTAMPLGLDTPSTFGMVFFVLGPCFLAARQTMPVEAAALHTWHVGICAMFISGVFKFACAFGSAGIRRMLPRAGLLGSLTAIALVLISFLPLLEVLHVPVVGLVSLAIVLVTLVARVDFPGRLPGALAALLVGAAAYYGMKTLGLLDHEVAAGFSPRDGLLPVEWLSVFRFEWLSAWDDTVPYLPIVIPFALATVVGGIDCTESAAAAGDEFDTGRVILVEACATLVASVCGGVIQTTPYIGHPAYKAMGGRAAYALATALFVGAAGTLGFFSYFYAVVPKAAVFPILIFIGLEISAQSFHATPRRHYAAIVLGCVPPLAALAAIYLDKLLPLITGGDAGVELSPALRDEFQTIRVLANGFIVTSLLWASSLAMIIDRHFRRAALVFAVAAVATLFGIMHSPFPGSPLCLPWRLTELAANTGTPAQAASLPWHFAAGYAAVALWMLVWSVFPGRPPHDEFSPANSAE